MRLQAGCDRQIGCLFLGVFMFSFQAQLAAEGLVSADSCFVFWARGVLGGAGG